MGRISLERVAADDRKFRLMGMSRKTVLMDEIYLEQPNLLACCVVQGGLGADERIRSMHNGFPDAQST